MNNVDVLKYKISAKEAEELRLQSALTTLPEDGLYLMNAIDKAIDQGLVNKEEMLSGQDMLLAIAEKLENEGNNPDVVSDIITKLRLMSVYATTRLVPVSIPE